MMTHLGPPEIAERPLVALESAVATLQREGRVDAAGLVDAYVACQPIGHRGADHPLPDPEFLAHALALGGTALLEAPHWVVGSTESRASVRVLSNPAPGIVQLQLPRALDATGDALAWCLGVACEARKLVRLDSGRQASAPWSALLAACAGCSETTYIERLLGRQLPWAEAAREVDALVSALLRGGTERTLYLGESLRGAAAGFDATALEHALQGTGPLFVLAGATERLHDLASPYLRRLAGHFDALLASPGGLEATQPDARYEALAWFFAEAPGTAAERAEAERVDGFLPVGELLVLRFESMAPALADPRAQAALSALKRSRARAVVCPRDADLLTHVLGAVGERCLGVFLLSEGFVIGEGPAFPRLLEHGSTGHLTLLPEEGFGETPGEESATCISLPSLGVAGASALHRDTLLFPLANAVLRARARGFLPARARLRAGLAPVADARGTSALALRFLTEMAQGTETSLGRRATGPAAPRWRA